MLPSALPKSASTTGRRFAQTLTSAQFKQKIQNEPTWEYKKGSAERTALDETIQKYVNKTHHVPLVIGGQEIDSNEVKYQLCPYDHKHRVAQFSYAGKEHIGKAIDAALEARKTWQMTPLKQRAEVLYKAADLAADKYRHDLNAATMVGQGKTIVQAEIDSAAELIDFFRFGAHFAEELDKWDPISTSTYTNKMIYRALDGFIASISPFNFTAIGANLGAIPTLMGNGVVWKPSDTALLSNYIAFKILREAGLPDGVCNFVPSDGPVFGETITSHRSLAAINFTGSLATFRWLWKKVGERLETYDTFPRLVGECGGKNFHFIHPSADLDAVAAGTIRGAFEYQGQKCSATSRMYVPKSVWPTLQKKMVDIHSQMKQGPAHEDGVFLSAVIDDKSFARIKSYIDYANGKHKCIAGGKYDDSVGYFVQPSIYEVADFDDKMLKEEIFGPVLAVYVYPDEQVDRTLDAIVGVSPYGLTGSVFSEDKDFLYAARDRLRDAVGNLYLNDKSTGSIVCQQPFGGARLSGTNDKAGGPHYNLRWASPQTIKETPKPPHEWKYPYME